MNLTRKLVTSLLLLALLTTEACNKKKPPLPLQAQAPTIAETLPQEIPEEEEPALPTPRQKPNDTEQSKKPTKKSAKPPAKKTTPPASTTVAATPPPAPAPAQPPAQTPPPQSTQTVASLRTPHSNSTSEPVPEMTVAAAIPSDKANKQREDTARMVDSTENSLKNLTRQLNDEEKSMRSQIETYLQQSRKATTDGDYERAYKLAEKAQTLAAALTKQ